MRSIANRLRRSIAMRGARGTLEMCCFEVYSRILPRYRQREARRRRADEQFDLIYGVDTKGIVRPNPDEVVGEHWEYGITYQAVDAEDFEKAMRGLEIQYEDFSFVDYGAGKGRALLLASQLPFKRVTGVEYCLPLADVAAENLKRYKGPRRCSAVEIVQGDAADYIPNEDRLVLFFFNPFGEPVMKKVVRNIAALHASRPRPIFVVYFTPYFAHLWESTGIWVRRTADPAVLCTPEPHIGHVPRVSPALTNQAAYPAPADQPLVS